MNSKRDKHKYQYLHIDFNLEGSDLNLLNIFVNKSHVISKCSNISEHQINVAASLKVRIRSPLNRPDEFSRSTHAFLIYFRRTDQLWEKRSNLHKLKAELEAKDMCWK